MKKYFFALFCALVAATSAMAAPQAGDRIVAAQVHAVEWNDAAFRPTMDGTSFDLGLNAQLTPSEDESVLILSGLCDLFNIPVHVDYTTGKAWIETGMPLDAYTDQYNRVVVRTIYVLLEQCLADAEADMNANLYGSILEDGSIAFNGGIVFLVSESTDVQDVATAGDASETVWMSSPLFRDMRLLVPNAIHQFRVDNEAYKSVSKPKPGFDELTEVTKMTTVRNGLIDIIHGGFRPSKPNGPPPVCGPGSGNNDSADTSDGNSTLNKSIHNKIEGPGGGNKPFKPQHPGNCKLGSEVGTLSLGSEVGTLSPEVASGEQVADGQGILYAINNNTYVVNGGYKKKKKDDDHCCSEPGFGNLVFAVAPGGMPGGQIAMYRPYDGKDFPTIIVFTDSAGHKPVKPSGPLHGCSDDPLGSLVRFSKTPGGQIARIRPFDDNGFSDMTVLLDSAGRRPVPPTKPRPCRPDGSDEVGRLRPNSGGNVYAPNHDNDNIEAGHKPPKPIPPVRGCSDPWIWITKLESFNNQLPTRFGPTPSVASSKPADEQFSVPVYVFQNLDDNTITVYNLFGEGGVTTCKIVPEERKMSIADVTELIDHLLTAGNDGANQVIDDVNGDGKINIDDVTTLIDTLLNAAN